MQEENKTRKQKRKTEFLQGFVSRLRECVSLVGGGGELSRKSGIPRSTLETYLTGQSEPKATRLHQMAKAANVSLDWLITGQGRKHPAELRSDLPNYLLRLAESAAIDELPGQEEKEAPLNMEILREAMGTVEKILQEKGITCSADRKAGLVAAWYEFIAVERAKTTRMALEKFLKSILKE